MIFINALWFYPVIIGSAILLVLFILIIFKGSKRKKMSEVPPFEYEALLESLGGATNILDLAIEHQRLKVILKDLKKVNQAQLVHLKIPAFLKGKELTLLIKQHTKEVLSYLSERRKEDI